MFLPSGQATRRVRAARKQTGQLRGSCRLIAVVNIPLVRVMEVARAAKAKSDLNAIFNRKIEVEGIYKVVNVRK